MRSLSTRKLRSALTAVAIVLGVAFVTGTYVLTDTSSQLFDEQFADVTDGVDLVVRSEAAFGAAMGVEVERDPVRDTVFAAIESTPGVKAAQPQIQGQALLFDTDGEAIVPKGASVAMSYAAPPLGAFELREGTAPRSADEIVIDAATASDHAISLGDRIDAQGPTGTKAFRVTGIAGFGDRDGMPNATVALFGYDAAAEFLDVTEGASQVLVVAQDSGTVETLREDLAGALGSGYEIVTSRDTAAASAAAAKTELSMVRIMLLVIAATALVVGAFLIANTFSITVSQRTRELAVLRAVGATARQTRMVVLIEATVVGVAASAVGALLGVGAAYGLRGIVRAAGIDLPDGRLVVAPRTLVLAVGIGVIVTLLSALAAARRAAKVAPLQALREEAAPGGMPRRRVVAGSVATVAGVVLAVTTAIGITPSIVTAGGSVVLMIVALAALAPAFAGRLAGVVGRPLRRAGVPGMLARASAHRAPRRTAATMSALAIGLAVVIFMTV
ncbi:MAG TPA: FtsX-like permease family protein, partial [Euzebyales bacterium]|nr:FtsX-like permease family protein [Euzebyales bacterium]